MKRILILSALVFIGALGWRVGSALSPDAIGIAVGVVFGVLASIPAALLMLVAGRRNERRQAWEDDSQRGRGGSQPGRGQANPYGGQQGSYPPVVIMTPQAAPMPQGQAGHYPGYYGGNNGNFLPPPNQMALPGPDGQGRPQRQFRVVGEEDGVDGW